MLFPYQKPLFDKILIANRGEIACRVIKTAKSLGIKTVSVFSEVDRNSMHVQMADEAICIGPAPAAESYLKMDEIIRVAKQTKAKAIHPGYGFLSENAEFAARLQRENITFIGPPPQAILDMGSKSASKIIMERAGVSVTPGYWGSDQNEQFLEEQADKIGYPIMIKAVSGGGGKGMRIVLEKSQFQESLTSSKREAKKSFDDDRVLLEKYIPRSRHVEVQVFADVFGNAVYLFERDCSLQRRHQKILEEAPAPNLSEEMRRKFGEMAVAAAKAVNYVGAGTVEFILDCDSGEFYFMEMNTRLQVEHPISELITGQDFVQWQLAVASGNELPLSQDELKIQGHAIEARIYAENPEANFMPDSGKLVYLQAPAERGSASESIVRVDSGVRQGDEVSVFYDPMIAKLIVKAKDRNAALRLMSKSLEEYQIVGMKTNINFLKRTVLHPDYVAANIDTDFIKRNHSELFPSNVKINPKHLVQAALFLHNQSKLWLGAKTKNNENYDFGCFRLNHNQKVTYEMIPTIREKEEQETRIRVELTFRNSTQADAKIYFSKGNMEAVEIPNVELLQISNSVEMTTLLQNERFQGTFVYHQSTLHAFFKNGENLSLKIPKESFIKKLVSERTQSATDIRTPMPCKITHVFATKGSKVKKGDKLFVLEAMKMEHVIKSPLDGEINEVYFKEGDLVEGSKLLATFVGKD